MAILGTTVIDFLGNVILGADSDSPEQITLPEAIERASSTTMRYQWMTVAMHAAAGYAIAGMLKSPIRIRGSGRAERDWEEWLWNVRPNPNQSRAQFMAQLVDRMFFDRRGQVVVVPAHQSLWIADSWVRREAKERRTRDWWRADTYENIAINGVNDAIRGPVSADEVFIFKMPETAQWRSLMRSMGAAYEEMAKSAAEAFGDKNARRWLLDVDAKMVGTQAEHDAIDEYLKNSVGAFVKGTDVAIPLYQGMSLSRAPSDYSGGESELDVTQIRADAFRTVANCLRIPVSFLEGNVNNFETVFEAVLSFFIDPITKAIEDEITAKSMTAMQWRHGSDARVDTTHIRHVDLFAVADKAEKLVGAMIDTPNEIREFTGQDRVEGKPEMDEYQMTKNHERAGGGENDDDTAGTDTAVGGGQREQG